MNMHIDIDNTCEGWLSLTVAQFDKYVEDLADISWFCLVFWVL